MFKNYHLINRKGVLGNNHIFNEIDSQIRASFVPGEHPFTAHRLSNSIGTRLDNFSKQKKRFQELPNQRKIQRWLNIYKCNPIIYTCIQDITVPTSQAKLKIQRLTSTGWKDDNKHLWNKFIIRPNKTMNFGRLILAIMTHRLISGVVLLNKTNDDLFPAGIALEPLDASVLTNTTGEYYRYTPKNYASTEIKKENVIRLTNYNPELWGAGISPIELCEDYHKLWVDSITYIDDFFENEGTAETVLTVKTGDDEHDLTAEELEMIEAKFNGEYGRTGKRHGVKALPGNISVQKIGSNLIEMTHEALFDRIEAGICGVFRTNPRRHKVGFQMSSSRANAEQDHIQVWQDVTEPMLTEIKDFFEWEILMKMSSKDFDDVVKGKLRLHWDFSNVASAKALEEQRNDFHLQAFQRGAISRGEFVEVAGYRPISDESISAFYNDPNKNQQLKNKDDKNVE